ncbi:putative FMN-dependent luciferase-like monooxygenase [Methylovirgula sp. 4M-Z18]|uniref:putative FMN-dependent luciferase-like monooxygenase n=1 Tax=Methylovirgula sp. 4M-Z18 TaxID=2293567 RepID=UPI000E2E885B|nr:putative FMN-dependent luciferase-like monooxygenase [Methylovirgula sp. 4M-Z18]RFB79098.1 putative FMN-dependent luciferase-like monooxygenase [Methylovirgula sp. 4M-Z18]
MSAKRLGFFTRLLDDVDAQERYRLATEQIVTAERFGFDSAWVAQHHFDADEGGLPAPLVFLAQVAAQTSRIRLGTGIITLPLENPVRVAEDTAVLDLLSGGRLEVGMGTGGTPSAFTAFGLDSAQRSEIFGAHLRIVLDSWTGRPLGGANGPRLYPAAPHLIDRVWQATFSAAGGARAGVAGDGLMLSRTQPRGQDAPQATLADLQNPIIDAYLAALPPGRAPRIVASRSVFVADSRAEARRYAEIGLRRIAARFAAMGQIMPGDTLDDFIAGMDVHLGTPDEVIESLATDKTLSRVTDLVFQVHSVDPPHPLILRSIELAARKVAPALGWPGPSPTTPAPHVALPEKETA